jgi:hypothetical protein
VVRELVDIAKMRWRIERDYQDLARLGLCWQDVEQSQIAQVYCNTTLIGTERLLIYSQCSLIERLGVCVAGPASVKLSQIVQRCRDKRMVGAEGFFIYGPRSLVERLGVRVATLIVVERSQIFQQFCDIGMIGTSALSRLL